MSALGKVVRSGVNRRRVQTLVIGLATMMAVAASVLGGSLLVVSGAPFDDAFAKQHGAHLSVQFDAGKVSAGQLSKSKDTEGVSSAVGPFRTATVTPRSDGAGPGWPMTVVGRGDPGRDVDEVALLDGRWPTHSGEIVLSANSSLFPTIGMKLAFPDLSSGPTLTVVGVARSVTQTADAWVVPSQMRALTAPGSGGYQMLYRFTDAGTAAQITAGGKAVTESLPPGTAVGEQSWLTVKKTAERDTALYVPFLVAFGALGLVMSVLIVGNVVASAVGTGTRRIGILKAVGFTPAQVVRAYVGQALIPAAVGTALGVLAGHLLAVPVLAETEEVYGTSSLAIAPWVDLAVIAGVLCLVAATAWASAWRAGRLRTVDALAVGRTVSAGRGRWAARLAGRLPLPQPVALGLARPFARPARALAMGTAILFGAIAVTFTVGMGASLGQVMKAKAHDAADVVVPAPLPDFGPQGPDPEKQPKADPAAVAAAIEAAAGTGKYYSAATVRATVSGLTGTIDVIAFTGDASWGGYTMVSGRWIDKPGEAVVPTPFLAATGTGIGDTVTLNGLAEPVTVRIAGEILDPRNDGMQVFTDASTLTAAHPDLTETSHHIAVTSGTDVTGYVDALNKDLAPLGATARAGGLDAGGDMVVTLNALSVILTLMLVAVAALGVLNGVLLDTRERVREIGVHKALGMTPRQTIAMVITSVVVTGLVAGALGVPLGVALHGWVIPAMGDSVGLRLPDSVIAVYHGAELLPLALGGLLIATLGALLPAGWAARARTATALRTE
ncbi:MULTISPECIES: FtsX-like permease family protein [unclassified Streptomyces]|uniref:ABC transporter permease n=1 Tax=unclassified Streptomyces TaxID=2593676 RepID=UPI002DD929C0|nr:MULTISPECIES: FtsX-like permease family protein [unclassified Streptomyces]WSC49994.1 FtsX-like permease family protein [Streptomyces sp. NBC_01762]WSC51244.1 FtsX-like permease family protein [Streptomyces sp. NBC_01761]